VHVGRASYALNDTQGYMSLMLCHLRSCSDDLLQRYEIPPAHEILTALIVTYTTTASLALLQAPLQPLRRHHVQQNK
jgi:hypothetical protein